MCVMQVRQYLTSYDLYPFLVLSPILALVPALSLVPSPPPTVALVHLLFHVPLFFSFAFALAYL